MPTVDVNGATLEYVETGAGDPVVLIHGGFSDHRIWAPQRDALGRHYRAITYSRRYHWPNAPITPNADYAMAEQVDDLRALLTALGAAPAHLIGNSYGANMALLLALQEPGLVRSLVLAEANAAPLLVSVPPKPLEFLRLFFTHPVTAAVFIKVFGTGFRRVIAAFERDDLEEGQRLFGLLALGPYGVERLTEARQAQWNDNVFKEQFTNSDSPPLNPDHVRQITIPTLLLSGKQSPLILRLLTDRLHEHMPRADRVDIPDASHDMHVDNPSAVTDAVLAFLARHSSSPSAA
jgi:pimeloyl-ACP methyl ester carboxylesterase